MSITPIADLALVSDRHSAGLIGRDGSVEWLCFLRFDGPSVFARLPDDDAGHWSVEAGPGSGELRGDFPQAFSHIGLVNTACAIDEAERFRGPVSAGRGNGDGRVA
jgi:GH15 family glucan-1,4-alpha-glucosidase